MRLKRAIHALNVAPNKATIRTNSLGGYNTNTVNRTERIRFVKGPARAVFPTVSLSVGPAIITAPGETILNSGEKMEIKVISAPVRVSRNSAHSP